MCCGTNLWNTETLVPVQSSPVFGAEEELPAADDHEHGLQHKKNGKAMRLREKMPEKSEFEALICGVIWGQVSRMKEQMSKKSG